MKTNRLLYVLCFLFLLALIASCSKKSGGSRWVSESKILQFKNLQATLKTVELQHDKLILKGSGFSKVKKIKLVSGQMQSDLNVESVNDGQIIASATSAISFMAGSTLNLVMASAEADTTFPIIFTLEDGSVTARKLSNMGATIGQVLKYDGEKWVPSNLESSQTYLGVWNATTNSPDLNSISSLNGDYYIVSEGGTWSGHQFTPGDWVMFNGASWERIDNTSTHVASFQGRRGVVTLQPSDYSSLKDPTTHKLPSSSMNDMGDVDLSTNAPVNGQILKYNSSTHKWVASEDLVGGGTNSVGTAELQDNSVTSAKLNLNDGEIAQSKVNGLTTALAGKESSVASGTAGQYYRGDKIWATLNSAAVAESTNLYFTNARVLGVPLAGFTTATGAVVETDSVLSAMGKFQGQINSLSGSFIDWTTSGLQTIDPSRINLGISSSVVVTDATGKIISSSISSTELGHLNGASGNIQTQLNGKQAAIDKTTTLPVSKTRVYGVNGTNYTEVSAPSLSANTNFTLPSTNGSSGQVLQTDGSGITSWTALPSSPVTSVNAQTGAVVLNTSNINEGSNLYFTNARTLGVPLTGLTTATGAVVATDSVLAAFGKLQGQINEKLSAETDPNVQTFAKTSLPACSAGEVLISNGTALSCVTDNAGAGAYSGAANKLVTTDASGALTTSSVTNTEAGYLSGVTGSIQTQINSKQNTLSKTSIQDFSKVRVYGANGTNYVELSSATLTANRSLVFPDSNGASGQYLSTDGAGNLSWSSPAGGVTSVNSQTGAVTLTTSNVAEGSNQYFTNARAIASTLTGYTAGSNTALSATDTVLSGMQKLEGQIASKQGSIAAGTGAQYYRGDKTWATLDTSVVAENTNLYFTNARALGVPLTGFTTATGAVVATDSVLSAIGKLQGQLNTKSDSSSYIDWSTSGLQTIDPSRLTLGAGNASKAMVTSATGAVSTSSVTATELGYLSGVTSAIQTQLNAKQATISKTTTQDISKLRVYGANGTNYVEISTGTLTANRSFIFPDSNGSNGQILSTDGSGNLSWITPNAGGVTSVNSLTGAVTLTTTNVSEGTNLYYTNARGIASTITPPTLTNSAIASGDSLQTVVGKLQGQINNFLSQVLTGLSTATNSAITATDSVLVALGKLQAQITANGVADATKADKTNVSQTITAASVTGLTTPVAGSDAANKTYVDGLAYWTNSSGNIYRATGSVGIGTTTPGAPLDVKGAIRMTGSTSGYTGFQPAAAAGSTVWTLPATDGAANQVLSTNGAGILSWATAGGGSNALIPSAQTASFTITSANTNYVYLVNPSAGSATATLPAISSVSAGFRVLIKRTGFGFVSVAAASGETIEGSAVRSIDFQGGLIELMATTTGWEMLRNSSAVSSSTLCTEGNMTFSSPGESSITITQNMVDYCQFSIKIQGGGGGNASSGGAGGAGGGVQFNWIPGTTGTLGLHVGGGGANTSNGGIGGGASGCKSGTSGGGGGGGASAVTFTSGTSTLLAIAGGGGGGGPSGVGGTGGSGGTAGTAGAGSFPGGGGGANTGGAGGGNYTGGSGGSAIANGSAALSYCGSQVGALKVANFSISGGGAGGGNNNGSNTGAGGGGGGYGGGGGGGGGGSSSNTAAGGGGGGYMNTTQATSIQSIAGSAAGTDGKIIVVWTAK